MLFKLRGIPLAFHFSSVALPLCIYMETVIYCGLERVVYGSGPMWAVLPSASGGRLALTGMQEHLSSRRVATVTWEEPAQGVRWDFLLKWDLLLLLEWKP